MKVGLPKTVAASLLLVAGSATACSSSASPDEFCSAYANFTDALVAIDSDDSAGFIEELQDAADEFGDVGPAEDMSDDAKAGFELILTSIDNLGEESTLQELGQMEDEFTEEEKQHSAAFEAYLADNCDDADLGE